MRTNKTILGVILARGGSKGIPQKNIKELNGHPLMAYSLYAGLKCPLITHFVVSTDSAKIAKIAKHYGADVPFMRPKSLARDAVYSRDALHHTVLAAEKYYGMIFDFVIELPATAPLRNSGDVQSALNKLTRTKADSVISVARVYDRHPVRIKRIKGNRLFDFTKEFPEGESSRRQDLEAAYVRNGAIYAMKRSTIISQFSRVGKISRPYIMPAERSINIDEPVDFLLAETLIKKGCCDNHPQELLTGYKIRTIQNKGKPWLLFSSPYYFFPETIINHLNKKFKITYAHNAPPVEIKKILPKIEIWITSTCPPYMINSKFINLAPRLKIIATPSTGTNHIKLDYVLKRGITVLSLKKTKGVNNIYASSEFSFALMLATIKRLYKAMEATQCGAWRDQEHEFRNIELHGKTLGLIGFGRIGKNMAQYAKNFGMHVLAYDPFAKVESPRVQRMPQLNDLLRKSDIVSLHCDLNEKTKGMFNKRCFDAMKKGSVFLNTSRGEIIDEKALIRSLKNGKLKAAAVDVISNEHIKNKRDHPLIQYSREHDNLFVTPHIAGCTVDSETKAITEIIRQIEKNLSRRRRK